MDFWTAMRVLLRRWLVLVLGVLCTLGALFGVTQMVPPTYEARGELILLLPAQADAEATDIGLKNPYLGIGGSLSAMGAVVARALGGQEAKIELAELGDAEYVVDTLPGDAPILDIVTTSEDPDVALEMYGQVEAALMAELDERQAIAAAPEGLRIMAAPVRVPVEAERMTGSLLRAAAAVIVMGGALTLGAAFLVESISVRRSATRRGREPLHSLGAEEEPPSREEPALTDQPPAPEDVEYEGPRPPAARVGIGVTVPNRR